MDDKDNMNVNSNSMSKSTTNNLKEGEANNTVKSGNSLHTTNEKSAITSAPNTVSNTAKVSHTNNVNNSTSSNVNNLKNQVKNSPLNVNGGNKKISVGVSSTTNKNIGASPGNNNHNFNMSHSASTTNSFKGKTIEERFKEEKAKLASSNGSNSNSFSTNYNRSNSNSSSTNNNLKVHWYNRPSKLFAVVIIVFLIITMFGESLIDGVDIYMANKKFVILSTNENRDIEKDVVAFGRKNGIKIKFEYAEDLEAVTLLNSGGEYDAVWASNSLWLYQVDKVRLTNSKSISINPVVMAIKSKKAKQLGFIDKDITNKELVDVIKNGQLKYVMSSIVKTNSGASSYLGFLNSLAGSPEVLTKEMIHNPQLKESMISLFSGVERVSGTDTFLEDMFLKSNDYEAVIAAETSLININKKLESDGKDTLYLIYPTDGVSISDSPFAYVDRAQKKEENFKLIQQYLLSKEMQKKLEDTGRRTWYGGINKKANKDVFRKEWGIDTSEYLIPLKYPSKQVINDATRLYVEEFRKPSHTIFLLDYSGSMYGEGNEELVDAMNYILNYEEAAKDFLQFSTKDKISVIPFTSTVGNVWSTTDGTKTYDIINSIESRAPNGGTNIYIAAVRALQILQNESDDYTKTVILMTDGESINDYDYFEQFYNRQESKVPIYSIMFGNASSKQLDEIAELTNAKVFDGRTNLLEAFKEVRSFN